MSLFDVIRYPITDEFRREDLKRIPAPILIKWWENMSELELGGFQFTFTYATSHIINPDTRNIKRIYLIGHVLKHYPKSLLSTILKSLKKYILEYDPITCD